MSYLSEKISNQIDCVVFTKEKITRQNPMATGCSIYLGKTEDGIGRNVVIKTGMGTFVRIIFRIKIN